METAFETITGTPLFRVNDTSSMVEVFRMPGNVAAVGIARLKYL